MIEYSHHGLNRACLRIIGAVDQAFQTRMHHGSGAHRARFNCSKQFAVAQTMVTYRGTGLAYRDDFGVRRWVTISEIAIPSSPDNLSVAYDYRAHRNFSSFKRPLGGA